MKETKFIKAKGIYGDIYVNINHIQLICTSKDINDKVYYQIQYEDCLNYNRLAEISKEDYESLVQEIEAKKVHE